MPQLMQKAAMWQIPMAIGVASWSGYVNLVTTKKCLFYWWEPDSTFISLEAKYVIFPEHKPAESRNNNYTNAAPNARVENVVSYDLQNLAPDVHSFMSKFNFTINAMRTILLEYATNGTAVNTLACNWLKNNEVVAWSKFQPLELERGRTSFSFPL